jgi:hypothetical protein
MVHSRAQDVLISFTRAPLFSGSLEDCKQQPNNKACTWGLVTALAKHRLRVNTTNATFHIFIPYIDTRSALIDIHPDQAGLNIKLYKSFNISHYTAEPWFLFDLEYHTPLGPFLNKHITPLMTTRNIPEYHPLRPYVHRYLLLQNGDVAVLRVGLSESSFVSDLLPRLQMTVGYLRRSGVGIIVLLCQDNLKTADWYVRNLGNDYAVDVAVDLLAMVDAPCTSTTIATHNTTKGVVCGASSSSMTIVSLLIRTHNGHHQCPKCVNQCVLNRRMCIWNPLCAVIIVQLPRG